MNKIVICGRLVRDPELRTTSSGMEVCGFTVAVDRRIKKEPEKATDYIDCTAWGKTGAFVQTYFHKGDGITVDGRMESRKWVDSDGKNRVSWGITCDNVEFPLGKNKAADAANQPQSAGKFTEMDVLPDEDMPF